MALPYNLNFPQSTDYMRDSQPLMLDNYASIFTFMGADHINFNLANAGFHRQMTFPQLESAPESNAKEMLYATETSVTEVLRLFIQTAAGVSNSFDDRFLAALNLGGTNYIQLPSGVILKWGLSNAVGTGIVTHTWDLPDQQGAFTTQLWAIAFVSGNGDNNRAVYITDISDPNNVSFINWQRNAFDIQQPAATNTVLFAIGV